MKGLGNSWSKAKDVSKPSTFTTVSPDQALASVQHCSICNEIIGVSRADNLVENAAVLPCSHIFGELCISRWLESDSLHHNCPICRRRMIYEECGHTIRPCGISRAPSFVEEKEMPKKCFACRGGGLVEDVLVMINERRLAEEKILLGMRKCVFGFFDEMCGTTVESVDERIKEVRERWKDAAGAFCRELEEKEGRDQW